ncbi:hypothetical protein RhiJN_02493 [Ceratobasidium sp. AG-Ba]|nr:hypothetical protein RhiJN_02493 [Ceratobasidium sp. AG-Ba]QRW03421.1 hypothetical protein RhiLY_02420 [Ceratobasidium sp. AG-Ba]
MPTTDVEDQHAARGIEKSLRDAVNRQERPPIELQLFETLPKRVRQSAELIKAAQVDSRVLLEHVRSKWSKTRRSELEREERLNKARSQPRNLEVLRAPEPTAWQGLGRRKKRCRAFESIGRVYTARQQLSGSDSLASDTLLLHPSSCNVPKRSPTPPGLRDAIRNVPGLIHTAIGPANPADYGLPTPLTPESPVTKSLAPPVIPPPEFPHDPQPEDFVVDGHDVCPDFSYVVAYGRHSRAPEMGYSTQRAALDVHAIEGRFPGALDYLAKLFFPAGVHKYGQMVNADGMESLLDFVFGWYRMSSSANMVPILQCFKVL